MTDKISTAIAGIGNISAEIKEKVAEIFEISGATTWTKKLAYGSPFLILKPRLTDYLDYIVILQDLYHLMKPDDYSIAIFYNVDTKNRDDVKFSIIHSLGADDDQVITISHTPENQDGLISSLQSDSSTDFLNFFSSENYALGFFILLNKDDLYPTFTIKDFSGTEAVDKTFSIRDLIGYLYSTHAPNPYIHTQKYALNIIGIRSNWGYEKDTSDNNKWKYKKRKHFRDWLIVFYIDNTNKWKLKKFPLTTFPDDAIPMSERDSSSGYFIMPKGRHENLYKLDYHKVGSQYKKHKALRQRRKIRHIRDQSLQGSDYYDYDSLIDPNTSDENENGNVFANIHTTHTCNKNNAYVCISRKHVSKDYGDTIGGFSEGCQVVPTSSHTSWGCKDDEVNDDSFMKLVQNQIDNSTNSEYGNFDKNYFTYFLIEEWDFLQFVSDQEL